MTYCGCMIKVGIIGGCGFDDPDIMTNKKETKVSTPFGVLSDMLVEGEISGVRCVFVARHARIQSIMPSNINYRANVWALKEAGCTHILVTTTCGSLREEIKTGDFVVPHDFIDHTTKRMQTFADGQPGSMPGICRITMYPSFNEKLRQVIIASAKELSITPHEKAIVVAVEGPRFSSHAESLMFRQWGGDVVNMIICPEVVLAKEAGLLYASLAVVTYCDSWREDDKGINSQDVLSTIAQNIGKVKKLVAKTIEKIATEDWGDEIQVAKDLAADSIQAPK